MTFNCECKHHCNECWLNCCSEKCVYREMYLKGFKDGEDTVKIFISDVDFETNIGSTGEPIPEGSDLP